jgi:hypothetical protein
MILRRTLIPLLALSALLIGCGENEENGLNHLAYPSISLLLAPGVQDVEITRVVLTISGPGMDTQETDMNLEGRKATKTVSVPVGGDRLFAVAAYSGDDLVYDGEKLVDVEMGSDAHWEILLKPVRLNMAITPQEIEVSAGDIFDISVRVGSVKELFGCSFELEYDADRISPIEQNILPGNFLGEGSQIVFLSQVESGKISIGITRKAGAGGVSGSGVIALMKFRALTADDTPVEIGIADNDDFALHKEDGMDVDGFQKIITVPASIVIK